jgi:3-oxoacyl-[acyl-carrier-protein] synthase II
MGEESAGIDAVRIALSRVVAGQSDIVIVGCAFDCEREDRLLICEFASYNLKERLVPVWDRNVAGGGFALGSLGAFLVIEVRCHAEARAVEPLAPLSMVMADRSNRRPGAATASLHRMWRCVEDQLTPGRYAVISGASGAEPATGEERTFLRALGGIPIRATGTYLGHGMEPQFPMNVALATLAVGQQRLFPPCDTSGMELPMPGELCR